MSRVSAQLTDSKLNLIERLTMSQIDINAQLERINRSKTEALDRLVYTQFNVSVYENKFIDGKEISNSWTAATQELFRNINNFAQEVSLGFVALLFLIVKYALYGVVLSLWLALVTILPRKSGKTELLNRTHFTVNRYAKPCIFRAKCLGGD